MIALGLVTPLRNPTSYYVGDPRALYFHTSPKRLKQSAQRLHVNRAQYGLAIETTAKSFLSELRVLKRTNGRFADLMRTGAVSQTTNA